MNIVKNKGLICLSIVMIVSFIAPMLQGMESKEEPLFVELLNEHKQEIRLLLIKEALTFLGSHHPITLVGHIDAVCSIAIASDKVVTGSYDGEVKTWDISTGQLLNTLVGHTKAINAIVIAGDKIVTASDDKTAKIWDIKDGNPPKTLSGHTGKITSVAIAGNYVVTGSSDNTAKIWDIKTDKLLHTLAEHTNSVKTVAISDDKVVTGSRDNTAKIWDINTGKSLYTLVGHDSEVFLVEITDDKVITRSSSYNAKRTWNINTGELLNTSLRGSNLIANTGDKQVSMSINNGVVITDLKTDQYYTLKGTRNVLATAAHDKVVTASSRNNMAHIWSLSPKLIGKPENNPLVWIVENTTVPQFDFVNRAYKATIEIKDFIIALPEKLGEIRETESQAQHDGRIYFTFPERVRDFLRVNLNIRK